MAATGQPEEAFWALTPRQTARAIKAAEQQRSREEQSRRWHTWHAAALPNVKKFPSFKEFVPAAAAVEAQAARPQSAQQQQAALMQVFAARHKVKRQPA